MPPGEELDVAGCLDDGVLKESGHALESAVRHAHQPESTVDRSSDKGKKMRELFTFILSFSRG